MTSERAPGPVVELTAVTKRFDGPNGRLAVDGIDLAVPAGSCVGLLGPNGAGKTTTLRMIYGVTRPTSGTVRVFGIDAQVDPRAVRRRLGVALQENALMEEVSAETNLRVFGRYHLLAEPELSQRVNEMMDFLDLRSHAGVPARMLSGGFQRRIAIARALMNRPELLILDEPTTGLDPAVRQSLWARVRDLRRGGTTVLVTTHYMDEAERLCDSVVVFAQGRVVGEGAPHELIERHLAAEAIEVECSDADERALLEAAPDSKRLRAGNRLIVYANDAAPLLERAHVLLQGHGCRPIVRPTNLEDVFLALTGAPIEETEP